MRRCKPEPREEPDQLRRYQREVRLAFSGRRGRSARGQLRRVLLRLRRLALRERVPFIAGKGCQRGACNYALDLRSDPLTGLGELWIVWGARDENHEVRLLGWFRGWPVGWPAL